MTPRVDTNDLIDATEVAEVLGLSHRNSVSLYQRRYAEMPRPLVERAGGRIKLWSRRDVARWGRSRSRVGEVDETAHTGAGAQKSGTLKEGDLVTARITARLAVELVVSGAGDEERALGDHLLRRLDEDPNGVLEYSGTIVMTPGSPSAQAGGLLIGVAIPELTGNDDLVMLRPEELEI